MRFGSAVMNAWSKSPNHSPTKANTSAVPPSDSATG